MVIRGDVLDLPDMQRRGLLKKNTEKKEENVGKVNSQGYVDFSSFRQQTQTPGVTTEPVPSYSSDRPTYSSDTPAPSFSDGAGALGFLDALASSAPASSVSLAESSYGSSSNGGADNVEIQGLKNKIEDLEYKLDRLMEKIAKMEGSP